MWLTTAAVESVSASLGVIVTVYSPGAAYVWLGEAPTPVPPSPKVQVGSNAPYGSVAVPWKPTGESVLADVVSANAALPGGTGFIKQAFPPLSHSLCR
jgi:hypothetical protein